MDKTFVVFDDIIQGVIIAKDENDLKEKMERLLSGVKDNSIAKVELPDIEEFSDFMSHTSTVTYDNGEKEWFEIQQVMPIK